MNSQTTTAPDKLLLRLPSEIRSTLQLEANKHRRSLTSEIIGRLEQSLEEHPSQSIFKPKLVSSRSTNKETALPPYDLEKTEQAMLEVFRRLPPEKQLALLSLFK